MYVIYKSFIYNKLWGNQLDSPEASAAVLRMQRNVSFEPSTLEMFHTPSSSSTM
jgi:hypothetical protein